VPTYTIETRYSEPRSATIETSYTRSATTARTGYTRAAYTVETGYGGDAPTPTAFALLLEDGSYLLLEDGSKLLLE
jgi:hypothetical protein